MNCAEPKLLTDQRGGAYEWMVETRRVVDGVTHISRVMRPLPAVDFLHLSLTVTAPEEPTP